MKRKPLFFLSLGCVIVLAIIWIQYSSKTNFAGILDRDMSDANEIRDVVIEANIVVMGETMWTRIEDPLLIDQLLAGLSDISLAKELTKNTRILNHAITLSTRSKSTVYYFDEEHFVGVKE